MKKTRIIAFILTLLLFLLNFSGCAQTHEAPEAVEGPKLADLVETDTLVIYVMQRYVSNYMRSIDAFREASGIDVEVVSVIGDHEVFTERVINDMAGGSGPDVLFLNDLYSLDVTKAALNNNFLDLTDILAEDPDFSEDDYLDGVFEDCRFGGRQYTIPTSYCPLLLLSTQAKIEELGFSWEQIEKTSDFLAEISRLTPYAKQKASSAQILPIKNAYHYLFPASGISLIDYENNVILPDEEALSEYLHAYKTYFPYDYDESGTFTASNFGADDLVRRRYFFWFVNFGFSDLTWNIDTLEESPYGYELYALPSQTGDIVGSIYGQMAISASSKNQLNAYNFIKMMLSGDIQVDDYVRSGAVPIHKEAIKTLVYGTYEYYGLKSKYAGHKSTQLSDEELDALIEIVTRVDRFTQPISTHVNDMLFECMLPFFQDEKSYEDCLANLKSKLTLYLSE